MSQTIGNYEILENLGDGQQGIVYKARSLANQQIIALKILKPQLAEVEAFTARFQREAVAMTTFDHPYLVKAFEFGVADGLHFCAMEFVEGETLYEKLRRRETLDERQALYVAQCVVHGLQYAWERGIVHRDIKPANIMIQTDGRIRLMDMGLAKNVQDEGSTVTQAGAVVGSPAYASPEQLKGQMDIDVRTDFYGVGTTLFHLVCGRTPFDGPSAGVVASQNLSNPMPDPREFNPELSDHFCTFLRWLTEKNAGDRYQTPREVIEAIDHVLRGENPRPEGAGPVFENHSDDTRERHTIGGAGSKLPVVLGVVVVVVAVVFIIFFDIQNREKKKAETNEISGDRRSGTAKPQPGQPPGFGNAMPSSLRRLNEPDDEREKGEVELAGKILTTAKSPTPPNQPPASQKPVSPSTGPQSGPASRKRKKLPSTRPSSPSTQRTAFQPPPIEIFWRQFSPLVREKDFAKAEALVISKQSELPEPVGRILTDDLQLLKTMDERALANLPSVRGQTIQIKGNNMKVADVRNGKLYIRKGEAEIAYGLDVLDIRKRIALAAQSSTASAKRLSALYAYFYDRPNAGAALEAARKSGEDVSYYSFHLRPVLKISTNPPDADVTVYRRAGQNWKKVDTVSVKTPVELEVYSGATYRVKTSKAGHVPTEKEIKTPEPLIYSVYIDLSPTGPPYLISQDARYEMATGEKGVPFLLNGQPPPQPFAFETSPVLGKNFIIVTLARNSFLAGARIVNRTDSNQDRAKTLTIWTSSDKREWNEVWRAKKEQSHWKIVFPKRLKARFIKIGLQVSNPLHLQTVKIMGWR